MSNEQGMALVDKKIQADYQHRVNRVFKYIDENLDADLSLTALSDIAFFSPFHFHRVFKFITKETLSEYVTRRKIEKAALELIHSDLGVIEIAAKCGFKEHSSFTRSFKKYYGISPTTFKKQNPYEFSKIRQLESNNGQAYPDYEKYICSITNLKNWITMNAKIDIKETPEMNLAGVTHIGMNGVENAFEKLIKWANSKGLVQDPEAKMGRVFYDSFKVTNPLKVRMDIFLATNQTFETEGEIHKLSIRKGKCIVGRYEITPTDFEKAWSGLFIWMNENGYKKSVENPFEIYHNDFRQHPENKFIVDLHIPIE